MSGRGIHHTVDDQETDGDIFAAFRRTANLLPQFYAESVNCQNLAFEAGQTYVIMEMQEWMLGKLQEGRMITLPDILGYLQVKMDSLARADMQPGQVANAPGQPGEVANAPGQNSSASVVAPPDQGTAAAPQCPQDQNSAENGSM